MHSDSRFLGMFETLSGTPFLYRYSAEHMQILNPEKVSASSGRVRSRHLQVTIITATGSGCG